jgi:predicted nucleotide-binding protein (sugar kinase/HSP70/actin superfamily)
MSLFNQWEELAEKERTQEEYDSFWEEYFEKEKSVYEKILASKEKNISGTVIQLAQKYNMDPVIFSGFIYGINTSLVSPVDLDNLNEDTQLNLGIDFDKLYFNMLDAKADWLYNLDQWDDILTQEQRSEITKAYKKSKIVVKEEKTGRNDPCPCGSGKKYKKCCGK